LEEFGCCASKAARGPEGRGWGGSKLEITVGQYDWERGGIVEAKEHQTQKNRKTKERGVNRFKTGKEKGNSYGITKGEKSHPIQQEKPGTWTPNMKDLQEVQKKR